MALAVDLGALYDLLTVHVVAQRVEVLFCAVLAAGQQGLCHLLGCFHVAPSCSEDKNVNVAVAERAFASVLVLDNDVLVVRVGFVKAHRHDFGGRDGLAGDALRVLGIKTGGGVLVELLLQRDLDSNFLALLDFDHSGQLIKQLVVCCGDLLLLKLTVDLPECSISVVFGFAFGNHFGQLLKHFHFPF